MMFPCIGVHFDIDNELFSEFMRNFCFQKMLSKINVILKRGKPKGNAPKNGASRPLGYHRNSECEHIRSAIGSMTNNCL